MKRVLTLAMCLALAPPACAQSITLPPTLNVPAPGLVEITPTAVDADSVRFWVMDPGLQLISAKRIDPTTGAVGLALQAGTYRVKAIAAKVVNGKAAMSEPVECVVTVGTPPSPGPSPGPSPSPPADAFAAALQAAYDSDPEKDAGVKAANKVLLANVFGQAAALANDKTAGDGTVGKLFSGVQALFDAKLPKGQLLGVRKAIDAEMEAQLGQVQPAQVLDDAARAKYSAQFGRVSKLVNALK